MEIENEFEIVRSLNVLDSTFLLDFVVLGMLAPLKDNFFEGIFFLLLVFSNDRSYES